MLKPVCALTVLLLLVLAAPAGAVIVPGKGMAGARLGQCIEDVGVEEALEFLVPLTNERVSLAPANPAVNKAGVEGAELLTPPDAPLTTPSDSLF